MHQKRNVALKFQIKVKKTLRKSNCHVAPVLLKSPVLERRQLNRTLQSVLAGQCSNKGRVENMSSKVMSCTDPIEKTKKHLRSVLISEKGGVALDMLERDYRKLVGSFSF